MEPRSLTRRARRSQPASESHSAHLVNRPVILLVEDDREQLDKGREFLHADCSGVFDISATDDFADAETRLDGFEKGQQPLAALIVRGIADSEAMRRLLSRARDISAGVTAILIRGGEDPALAIQARRQGLVAFTVDAPWETPEVSFAPILRHALRAWESPEHGSDVIEIVGDQWLPRCHDVKDLLARHRVPYRWLDAGEDDGHDAKGATRIRFPDGTELVEPTDEELARKLGFSTSPDAGFYDLVIVGGGPAGLAAAVYASSEGLRTVIVERDVPGGQAGSSAMIENYLGFPDGISGAELASRAVTQAKKFGAEILLTRTAVGLRDDHGYRVLRLDDGTEITSHTVLLAMGVAYRKLEAEGAGKFTGAGVYYGAAAAEAARFRDRDVCLLGSGNSAAQAALLLTRYVRRLTIITIDETLETTMSSYLVDRLRALPKVDLLTRTSVVEVKGSDRLESIVVENLDDQTKREIETEALFIWIGARPYTDWLDGTLARDEQGFIRTGRDIPRDVLRNWPRDRTPAHLESSLRGTFVAGDVRHDSVKRVGSAVGEGAMAVQLIHDYLRER